MKDWTRGKVIINGTTHVRFLETANNTITTVRLENSFIIDEIKLASQSTRWCVKRHSAEWARDPNSATQKITSTLREQHPALDGRTGTYILSDAGFKNMIDCALNGTKFGPANLYDLENERAAQWDGHALTQETSKTYRKQSKPITRRVKQDGPGRPRKNI